jgi:hypothetical protein
VHQKIRPLSFQFSSHLLCVVMSVSKIGRGCFIANGNITYQGEYRTFRNELEYYVFYASTKSKGSAAFSVPRYVTNAKKTM